MKPKSAIIYIFLFSLAVIAFNVFSFRTGFTDSAEYIDVAKAIAGLINTNVFVMHSIVYSLYLALFIKILPSLLTIKLVNAVWLIFDAIFLYKIAGKKALYIWIFSPIAYYMSIWISPMLPISFLFLLAYYNFKKYEATDRLSNLIISALSFGLILSLRVQMLSIILFFILIFFFNKPSRTLIYFILLMLPTFLIRLLVDYYYFNMPFYTVISFAGTLFLAGLEGSSLILQEWFLFPFIIAPLAFLLFKIDLKKYGREIIFLLIFILSTVIIAQLRFFMPVAPFVVFLLSKIITNKQLIINTLLSIVLISLLTYPYFLTDTEETRVIQDLNAIRKEINPEISVVTNGGAYSFPALPTDFWHETGPRYIWSRDLALYISNESTYTNVELKSKPRFSADKIITITTSASQNRDPLLNQELFKKDLYFILNKKEFKYRSNTKQLTIIWRGELILDDINLVKCYQELCVFRK